MKIEKIYLGDGAYAEYDGWNIIVTTSNGIHTTNEICFEPEVIDKLFKYVLEIRKAREDTK